MEKKNKTNVSTVLLIIAIIVIAIMGFFIYQLYSYKKTSSDMIGELNNKINNLESNKNDNTNVSNNSQSQNMNKTENLDVNDELIKQLHGYILKSDDFGNGTGFAPIGESVSFYKDTKVILSSLSDAEKTFAVLENYKEDEIKKVNKSQVKNIIETSDINDNVNIYENLNNKAINIFNQADINWKDYQGCAENLKYNADCYYLVEYNGGGLGRCEYGYSEVQNAEKDQENLYIYDKFIYIDTVNEAISEDDGKTHIYTSANKTNEIGTEKFYDNFKSIAELYKKYENKLCTYKHTFKQRKDGSYYWFSSEQLEK